jgi:hypothetical protein
MELMFMAAQYMLILSQLALQLNYLINICNIYTQNSYVIFTNLYLFSKSEGYKCKLQALRQQYAGKKVIFGRDKLEHATGVLQKFHTIEKFFIKYPEWKDKV